MIDGMFKDTMVNMKWTDIQDYVDKNALVLLPLGVIEEHGPHLCLGTDIYTAHIQSIFIKQRLEEKGEKVVIAPPFYWGICQSTGGFIGSFKVRKETAKALLFDIMASLAEFGFKNIFGINAHGDIEQNITLVEAFKDVSEKLKINACFTFSQSIMHHYGLNGSEPYICPIKPQTICVSMSKYADVHGGDIETATMNHFYPHLTDIQKAKSLPPVEVGDDKIMTWLLGGYTNQLSSEGYLGAPADFGSIDVIKNISDIAYRVSEAILDRIVKA
jgi:creatinine amidohydrolase